MAVGLYQFTFLVGSKNVPGWIIGGKAHLGVISILAIVTVFAVPTFGVTVGLRAAMTDTESEFSPLVG